MRGSISWATVLALLAVLGMKAGAQAATLKWDTDSGTAGAQDGAGTWLDADKWWDGATSVTWDNAARDDAVIGNGGGGGTITLGTVAAGSVVLDNFTGTYTLSGGSLDQSGGIMIGANAGNVNLRSPISGTGGITVSGPSRVNLRDGGKTFSGDLVINAGEVLDYQFNDLGAGNLNINGGVLVDYWAGNFTRSLGTGPGQVQVPGGVSGFCGQALMTVKINNDADYEVVWGDPLFNPSTLVLQSPWASYRGTMTFQNKLDLNGADRTIMVNKDHQGQYGFAHMSNVIRNSDASNPAGITKTGPGRLILSGTNTYTGATIISEGTLRVTGSIGLSDVTVADGGALGGGGSVRGVAVDAGGGFAYSNGYGGDDTLTVTGDLTLADEWVIKLLDLGPDPLISGRYDLFTYGGNYTGAPEFSETLGNLVIDATDAPNWDTSGLTVITGGGRVYVTGVGKLGTAGDLNGDGDVDNEDIGRAAGNFTGASGSGMDYPDGDIDGDGDVDNADIGSIAGAFTGSMSSGSQSPPVPEPATLSLLALSGLALLRRRWPAA